MKGMQLNKFIAAEAAECIGCHACEIACAVAHTQENWPLSHSDFRPRIHVVGKGQACLLYTSGVDLNNELKTRREKLANLREQGIAFPNDFRRDHTSD